MNENMEYKSGIMGWAEVRFGGKIFIDAVSIANSNIVGIKLSECFENGTVGEKPPTLRCHDAQAFLLFDNIKSVDMLNDALMAVREMLKQYEEEKHKNEKI